MTELMRLLLDFDWVSFSLFMVAICCLCFVGYVGSLFSEEIIAADDEPPSVPETIDHPSRRKNDRKDS